MCSCKAQTAVYHYRTAAPITVLHISKGEYDAESVHYCIITAESCYLLITVWHASLDISWWIIYKLSEMSRLGMTRFKGRGKIYPFHLLRISNLQRNFWTLLSNEKLETKRSSQRREYMCVTFSRGMCVQQRNVFLTKQSNLVSVTNQLIETKKRGGLTLVFNFVLDPLLLNKCWKFNM